MSVTELESSGASTIDYFALNDAALRGFQGVEADMRWSKRPHRPALLKLLDHGQKIRHFIYTVTPALPVERITGPLREGPTWSTHCILANTCLDMALDEHSDVAVAWALPSRLWGQFAVTAAMEVAHATGCDLVQA
eukprot:3421404-Pyramimonas_sp.AAC.1